MWYAVKKFDDADGIRSKRPREPCDKLSQRQADQTDEDCQSADDQDRGLRRQDEWVGNERDEGNTFEMICHDRDGGKLCCKSQGKVLVDHARHHTGILFGKFGDQVACETGKRFSIKNKSKGCKKRKLKAQVPDHKWIGKCHDQGNHCQCIDPVAAPAQLTSQQ